MTGVGIWTVFLMPGLGNVLGGCCDSETAPGRWLGDLYVALYSEKPVLLCPEQNY